ncbi:MAG: CBS domain-containing protein [Devosia sp.]|jgi:CBS domain-containing protein|uniref:Histidine kinase n=1 Tax=Parazoarcus communis SWub3 = DSM 12120 TaxID=1121029 RepID=A0A323V1S7_9RHOO|nr:CBS domain-containing protein [Parazoarcus communis]NMG48025.1 CBS domain-containing protein [Parazoarcus communis]NMG69780.1 CBS domain-containing protein [Parazoarcus communis SWub3 = DSM 12120]PZA18073.1 histidine kinase [Azoarcus communis] [Parazoarcus communis SWub3 = DSM 12120]
MTMTVGQILAAKGNKAMAVAPDNSVLDALKIMAEHDIGAVLVTEGERLVGIFTERDYARKVALRGLVSRDVKVSELMTANPTTVAPSQTVDQVMQTMTQRRFRHLPVVENGKIAGIVTIGDMVKCVVSEQEATIQQLSSYIAGDLAT